MLQLKNANFLRCVDFVNSFVEDRLATLRNVIKDPALDQWNLYLGTPSAHLSYLSQYFKLDCGSICLSIYPYFKGTFCWSWLFHIQHLPFSVKKNCVCLVAVGRFEVQTLHIGSLRSNSLWHATRC